MAGWQLASYPIVYVPARNAALDSWLAGCMEGGSDRPWLNGLPDFGLGLHGVKLDAALAGRAASGV